jgi:hypothetical protein
VLELLYERRAEAIVEAFALLVDADEKVHTLHGALTHGTPSKDEKEQRLNDALGAIGKSIIRRPR